MKKPPSIIVALDLPLQKASRLVRDLEKVENQIAAYKISSLQVMESGLKQAVAELRLATTLPLIYDHQKGATDIPAIIEKQVQAVSEAGANAFIAVPHGAGLKSLESFVQSCKKFKIEPIVLLEMSHPGANDFLKENITEKIFECAVELGASYFVMPGNKPEKIKEYDKLRATSDKPIYFLSPGIGAQGGKAKEAVQAGCDFPIIGRAIYESENPAKEVEKIYKECLEGYRKR